MIGLNQLGVKTFALDMTYCGQGFRDSGNVTSQNENLIKDKRRSEFRPTADRSPSIQSPTTTTTAPTTTATDPFLIL